MESESLAEIQGIVMDQEEIDQFLRRQGFGVLSLADDGEAYGVPISFGYDGASRLFFVFLRVGEESKKESFAKYTEKACFTTYNVRSKHDWQSVIAVGTIRQVSGDGWDDVVESIEDNAWYPNLFSEAEPMRGFLAWEFQSKKSPAKQADNSNDPVPLDTVLPDSTNGSEFPKGYDFVRMVEK